MHGGMVAPQPGMAPGAPLSGWQPMAAAPAGVAPMAPLAAAMNPQLQGGGMPLGQVMSALETPLAGYDAPLAGDEMSRGRRRRGKKEPDYTTYVAVGLVAMTVILVIVLAVVLAKQGDSDEPAVHDRTSHREVKEKKSDMEGGKKSKTKKPSTEDSEEEDEKM